jgi:glycosyl transferase family 1
MDGHGRALRTPVRPNAAMPSVLEPTNALKVASRAAHKLRVAATPATWSDLGTNLSLRAHGRYVGRQDLSWPVSPDALRGIELSWPDRYPWAPQAQWLEPLHAGLSQFVPIERVRLQQPRSKGIVLLRLRVGGESHPIAVDYSDYPPIDEELARAVPLYFKMQHRRGGYGIPSVRPGGYPASARLYSLLGGARRIRAATRPRPVVYGRFTPNNDVRRRAVGLLEAQTRFPVEGGLGLRRYGRFLAESAHAAVCLDLPGRGPLCFRLIDYLAVGCCVVTLEPEASLHVPLEDGVQLAYVSPDLSNLVDVCEGLLADAERRARMRTAAADFFDRYLESRQLASYYLSEILGAIGR